MTKKNKKLPRVSILSPFPRVHLIRNEMQGRTLHLGCAHSVLHSMIDTPLTIGLDISTEEIRTMDSTGRLVQADANYIPFKNESFDTVIAGEIIEHLPNPGQMIAECNRVLKSLGKLIVTTPNRDSLINRLTHCYDSETHISLMNGDDLTTLVREQFEEVEVLYTPPCDSLHLVSNYERGSRWDYFSLHRKIPAATLISWFVKRNLDLTIRRCVTSLIPRTLREHIALICWKRMGES